MTPEQLRMARALLRMKVRDLAQQAGVDKMTISGIEAGKKAPHAQTVVRLREYLMSQGVVFIGAHEPLHGPTVAMRWDMQQALREQRELGENLAPGEDEFETSAWDEDDEEIVLDQDEVDSMRRYWSQERRMERLSQPSRKAIRSVIGDPRFTV